MIANSIRKARTSVRTNRNLVIFEMMITASILSVPFMTPFFRNEVGLTMEQIGLVQAVYTIISMLLNVPLGWVADKFSRKMANVAGDLICATTLLLYARAQTIFDCILCETAFGVGSAFSLGVDSSLLQHFCKKEDPSGKSYDHYNGVSASLCMVSTFFITTLGAVVGNMDRRSIIAISSITYFAGGIASIFIKDDSVRLQKSDKKPHEEIRGIFNETIHDSKLNVRIAAFILAREATHGIIWSFSAILLMVGIPENLISLGWAANALCGYIGSRIARKYDEYLPEWLKLSVPMAAILLGGITLMIRMDIYTIGLYGVFGMAQGWARVTALKPIKTHCADDRQTTVESIVRMLSQGFYIVAVWAINRAADTDLRFAILATLLIIIPPAIVTAIALRRQENIEKTENGLK